VSQPDADGWMPVVGSVGALDLSQDPDLLTAAVDEVRLFAGYAGWTRGQLEDEIEAGAWFVVDALEGDILNEDPESLWRAGQRRQLFGVRVDGIASVTAGRLDQREALRAWRRRRQHLEDGGEGRIVLSCVAVAV